MNVMLDARRIQSRISELAAEIEAGYPADQPIHMVGVLKGGFVFLADLARAMTTGLSLDFIAVSSYGSGTKSSGEVRFLKDLDTSIEDRHVLLVEDIVDTGRTLKYLQQNLARRQPRTLKTVCLLSKPSRREVEVPVDYIGFTIEDRFVVGYGLDYDERYRNLPYIAVLDGE